MSVELMELTVCFYVEWGIEWVLYAQEKRSKQPCWIGGGWTGRRRAETLTNERPDA